MNEVGHRLAEAFHDPRDAMFVMGRHREEHRRHARIGIEPQAGDDHGHAERVRPDALAAAQLGLAIDLPAVGDRILQGGDFSRTEPFGEGAEKLFEIALCGDGMDDGDHGHNYTCRAPHPR